MLVVLELAWCAKRTGGGGNCSSLHQLMSSLRIKSIQPHVQGGERRLLRGRLASHRPALLPHARDVGPGAGRRGFPGAQSVRDMASMCMTEPKENRSMDKCETPP